MDNPVTIAKIKNITKLGVEDGTLNFVVADKNGKHIDIIKGIKDILLYVNNVYVGIISDLTTSNIVRYSEVSKEEALNEAASGISQGDVKVFVRSFFEKEEQLMDAILDNAGLLTCYNCGEKITDAARSGDIAVLNIDPGESNYPHSPDEPASAAFTCIKCGLSGCQ